MLRIPLIVVAGLAAAAQAGIFSFASDNDQASFTFAGFGGAVTDAADASDPFTLLIDDDNGANNPLSYSVEFQADLQISYIQSVPLGGGLFMHAYGLSGDFGFYDLNSGAPILTATVSDGGFTALGLANSWLSSASAIGADSALSDVTYTWHLASNAAYGLYTGDSVGPADDAGFTLTFLQHDAGSGVGLDSAMLPGAKWVSEGSYSGSATFVPAPVSLAAFLGLGAIASRRRR
ncbi:MAG: hypothetical protein IPJ41_07465 [Phycisphaerales bacterium]|nr:hypothetical protein [Phycisphaerales bacterium]